MADPTTAAGRALLERASRLRPVWPFGAEERVSSGTIHKGILAIEAEAAAPYREALERLVDAVEYQGAPPDRRTRMGQAYYEARALLRREVGE